MQFAPFIKLSLSTGIEAGNAASACEKTIIWMRFLCCSFTPCHVEKNLLFPETTRDESGDLKDLNKYGLIAVQE